MRNIKRYFVVSRQNYGISKKKTKTKIKMKNKNLLKKFILVNFLK